MSVVDSEVLSTAERDRLRELGAAVIRTETEALTSLLPRIDSRFADACALMLACRGRVVVLGMGKSGHIGGKIAATLASTGTPAFFVHPGEAGHGDLGMLVPGDVVLALSNSGETDEILNLLPRLKRQQIPLIALTGRPHSTLAGAAEVHLDIGVAAEACPLGLAPTASTAATLAMGDALAIALLEQRGFTAEDFARSHPSGRLGRRLLLHVDDPAEAHALESRPPVRPHEGRERVATLIRRVGEDLALEDQLRRVGEGTRRGRCLPRVCRCLRGSRILIRRVLRLGRGSGQRDHQGHAPHECAT